MDRCNARRRLLLVREPIGSEPPALTAERLATIGEAVGDIKVDELVDAAYICLETTASDYTVLGVAHGWRIWHSWRH